MIALDDGRYSPHFQASRRHDIVHSRSPQHVKPRVWRRATSAGPVVTSTGSLTRTSTTTLQKRIPVPPPTTFTHITTPQTQTGDDSGGQSSTKVVAPTSTPAPVPPNSGSDQGQNTGTTDVRISSGASSTASTTTSQGGGGAAPTGAKATISSSSTSTGTGATVSGSSTSSTAQGSVQTQNNGASTSKGNSKNNTPVIVATVFGAIALLLIIVFATIYLRRYLRQRKLRGLSTKSSVDGVSPYTLVSPSSTTSRSEDFSLYSMSSPSQARAYGYRIYGDQKFMLERERERERERRERAPIIRTPKQPRPAVTFPPANHDFPHQELSVIEGVGGFDGRNVNYDGDGQMRDIRRGPSMLAGNVSVIGAPPPSYSP